MTTYELVSIEGYKLPDGSTTIMGEQVSVSDKARYVQEVRLIQQAIGAASDDGVIGGLTRRRAMYAEGCIAECTAQVEQNDLLPAHAFNSEVSFASVPLTHEKTTYPPEQLTDQEGTCGHQWRSSDWASPTCPMCALVGIVMSARSRIVSPAEEPLVREALKALIQGLEDVP